MPTLRRLSDGAGDSGAMSLAIRPGEIIQNSKPIVGYSVRVGSMSARSFSVQDYWTTTPVTEILEERETEDKLYVRFKTGNSEYEWIN